MNLFGGLIKDNVELVYFIVLYSFVSVIGFLLGVLTCKGGLI